MRFDEDILWSDGLFLQPHHLQEFQRQMLQRFRMTRHMMMTYPYGLINCQLNEDALRTQQITLKNISAVMPNGIEVSMPGNIALAPLDLRQEIQAHAQSFMVSLAVPAWNAYEANLVDDDKPSARRIFLAKDENIRDENTGDNEITIVKRRVNACLTTELRNNADLQLLPIFRVNVQYKDLAEPQLALDPNYIPPYLVLTPDCPLSTMTDDLVEQIKVRINKIHYDLNEAGFSKDSLGGSTLYNVLQLQTLNTYVGCLTACMGTRCYTPFDLYLTLLELLGSLSALHPNREIGDHGKYDHMDYAPLFSSVFMDLRSLILAEGISTYVKLDFVPAAGSHNAVVTLKDEHIIGADEYYLAIQCDRESRQLISAVERGDNLKLVNPAASSLRVRGIKLVEMRYPPRFLPALSDTLWFKLQKAESQRVWDEICKERSMLLDWAEEIFPNLKASLFITCLSQGEQKA